MKRENNRQHARGRLWLGAVAALWLALAGPVAAQRLSPPQLDNLVSRIALYPDPLLAQVLTASTYWDQIPDAAAYADEHSYLQGDQLADAIQADNVPWDPSVQALIPFPSVLDMMERDPAWTQALGQAVLDSRADVMDAVQRMRHRAYDYGYLRDCAQYHVVNGPLIEVAPVNPYAIYVPVYDPYWIYARPRSGFTVTVSFGPRIMIGNTFATRVWRAPRMDWRQHVVVIDNHPWQHVTVVRRPPVVIEHGRPGPAPMAAQRPAPAYRETHEVRPNRPDRMERRDNERRDERRDHREERRDEHRDDRRDERRDERR